MADGRRVVAMSPSLRGEGRHRDVVPWLAEVGESTDAGCANVLFSDASAAAVTCAIMKPEFTAVADEERRQSRTALSISKAMRRSASAPISANSQRRVVGGHRHRLGVEVAAGKDFAGIGKINGCRRRRSPRSENVRRRGRIWSAGAHHLRLAAQATGPAPCRSRGVRVNVGAFEQVTISSSTVDPGRAGRAVRGCARRTGLNDPAAASTDSAPETSALWNRSSISNRCFKAKARSTLACAIEQRQAFLWRQVQRLKTACASSSPPLRDVGDKHIPPPSSASDMCASGARSPDAPTELWTEITGSTSALNSAIRASITTGERPNGCARG